MSLSINYRCVEWTIYSGSLEKKKMTKLFLRLVWLHKQFSTQKVLTVNGFLKFLQNGVSISVIIIGIFNCITNKLYSFLKENILLLCIATDVDDHSEAKFLSLSLKRSVNCSRRSSFETVRQVYRDFKSII